ncbi:MAG: hypothetical protein WA748_10835, partial [Candidatus Acidiferrum sp.]
MKNRIPVGFPITRDALIFLKQRAKHLLETLTAPVSQKRDTLKFLLIQHWHLRLTSPAPQYFHRHFSDVCVS